MTTSKPDDHLGEPSATGEIDQTADLKRIQKGLNLGPLFRTIRRHALLVMVLTATVAAANTLMAIRTPRSYAGGFRLLVEPITNEAKLTDPSVLSRGGEVSAFAVDYPTLLQVLQSPDLLSKAAIKVNAGYTGFTVDRLTQDLGTKKLVIQRIGTNLLDNTKLIDVSYQGNDPNQVKAVLEALSKEYLNYSLEARKSRISGGVNFIESQLPELQQRVQLLQQRLQTLQQQYDLTDPNFQGTELAKQSSVIKTLNRDTQREIQEQKILYATLRNQLQLSPTEGITASVLSEDPRYQELLTELKKVESQIAVKSARFNDNSPVIESLQKQREKLSTLLGQETQRIAGQSLSSTINPQVLTFQNSVRLDLIKQLAEVTNKIQVLTVRSQELEQADSANSRQFEQIPAIIQQYASIQRELEIATKTLNQLTLQRDTLQVEVAQKEIPWQLVSEPKLSLDANGQPMPMDRGIKKKLPIGVAAGLVLGVASAMLLEKIRNIFFCTEDVQDAVKIPLLSVIPYSQSDCLTHEGKLVGDRLDMKGLPTSEPSLFKESFSALFASLRFLESGRSIRSLVISSASPGDGKTTVAIQLARAAAKMGQKVLLVDANLRVPTLHTYLGLPIGQGLADILHQGLDPMDWIQESSLTQNLFVLTAGNQTVDSPQCLASSQMQHLVSQLQKGFDLVIYDTPHILGLTDTSFLTAYTDGLLLVISIGKTKRSIVMRVLTDLQAFNLPVVGFAANHLNTRRASSYGYQSPVYQPKQKLTTSL